MSQDTERDEVGVLGARSLSEIFLVFLRLGLTSFGGPVAHLGYYRDEFVQRRRWLDEGHYADLIALAQLLPGPSSSQVGFAIGHLRGGLVGALAAWVGFTAPSAIAMILFGYGIDAYGHLVGVGALRGLQVAAVAVVALAVLSMGRALTPDRPRITLAALATLLTLSWPGALGQIAAIVAGALAGLFVLPDATKQTDATKPSPSAAPREIGPRVGRLLALASLGAFFVFLAGLPIAASLAPSHALALVDRFYRAGALVFGGGHVVLPLLQASVVPPGWISNGAFLAGYGAAQALPGPLFTFAAYLGTVMEPGPNGWIGALLCLGAIYLPSFFLMLGALPFWDYARGHARVRAALAGINAAVVGLLLAALYRPVWTSAIHGAGDFALALAAFVLLAQWRARPWLVVLLSAGVGALIGA
ncbi:MAG TPA: chromate efflux transporter [Alphaproteobacteria bacterium]|nr:chromate efflux transporter [Alphaproteobacteria bacterium]